MFIGSLHIKKDQRFSKYTKIILHRPDKYEKEKDVAVVLQCPLL